MQLYAVVRSKLDQGPAAECEAALERMVQHPQRDGADMVGRVFYAYVQASKGNWVPARDVAPEDFTFEHDQFQYTYEVLRGLLAWADGQSTGMPSAASRRVFQAVACNRYMSRVQGWMWRSASQAAKARQGWMAFAGFAARHVTGYVFGKAMRLLGR